MTDKIFIVLFLCADNFVSSVMAETPVAIIGLTDENTIRQKVARIGESAV